MNDISRKISDYLPLNELERVLKYLFINNISLEEIDYTSRSFQKLIDPEKNLTRDETARKFRKLISSINHCDNLPTEVLIPEGRSLYIRKFPRYLNVAVDYHRDALEINVVLQGTFFQYINSNTLKMEAGDICFVAPGAPHTTRTYDDNTVVLSILVYQHIIKNLLNEIKSAANDLLEFLEKILYGARFYPFLLCRTGFDEDILGMIMDMEKSQDLPGPYTDKYIESGLRMFILRLLVKHKDAILLGSNIEKSESEILNLLDYIEANISTVTLESLAKIYNYSESYLSGIIKKQYGKTFTEITTEMKMKKAVDLLLNSNLSMTRIAEESGYNDKSHFLHRFKNIFGMTPSEYRASVTGR